jgi:hypothetical protein
MSTLRLRPSSKSTTVKVAAGVPVVKAPSASKPIILDDVLASVPPESNQYLRQKEKLEYDHAKSPETQALLPTLDDAAFNSKLMQHAEFHAPVVDDGSPLDTVLNVEEESNKVCSSKKDGDDDDDEDDTYLPHQLFVRNFLSPSSPYNSLLFITETRWCVALGLAEEWRTKTGHKVVILTLDDGLKNKMFKPDMLEQVGDRVLAKSGCIAESLLREVNPTNAPLTVAQAEQDVKRILEMGYDIVNTLPKNVTQTLIIVDNVPVSEDMMALASKKEEGAGGNKWLLMYRFPMQTSPREIIDVVNLMNANDKRGLVDVNEVFDKNDKFVEEHKEQGHIVQESGEALLRRKLNGYVSFLRSENPYTHPLRIYPDVFAPDRVFRESATLLESVGKFFSSLTGAKVAAPTEYPKQQVDGKPFDPAKRLRHLPLFLTALGDEQEKIVTRLFQATTPGQSLSPLMEAMTMTYPPPVAMTTQTTTQTTEVGTLESTMIKANQTFSYKNPENRIFGPGQLAKWSGKLSDVCSNVKNKAMIFCKDVVPVGLALEEHGFARSGGPALLSPSPSSTRKYRLVVQEDSEFYFKAEKKKEEEDVVLVISYAAAAAAARREKNVRQVHFLDPPDTLNEVEELLGMAIYSKSHCGLPFAKRNVEIYMHASVATTDDREMPDAYAYRVCADTARAMGKVTRIMKEVAVDLLFAPRDFSMDHLGTVDANRHLSVEPASYQPGKPLEFQAGDRPYSAVCDYMQTCTLPAWASAPRRPTIKAPILLDNLPLPRLTQRLRELFQEKATYTRTELLAAVQIPRMFSVEHVLQELARLVKTKSDVFYDTYGRRGYLVLRGNEYAFQPVEITDTQIGTYERTVPVEVKPATVPSSPAEKPALAAAVPSTILQDIQQKVAVASGDSEVELEDAWYETAQQWFNELQIVHRIPPEKVRGYVVDHAIETLSDADLLTLVTSTFARLSKERASATERRIGASLVIGQDGILRVGRRRLKQAEEDGTWSFLHNLARAKPLREPVLQKSHGPEPLREDWFLDPKGELIYRGRQLSRMHKPDLLTLLDLGIKVKNKKVTVAQLVVLAEILLRSSKKNTSVGTSVDTSVDTSVA